MPELSVLLGKQLPLQPTHSLTFLPASDSLQELGNLFSLDHPGVQRGPEPTQEQPLQAWHMGSDSPVSKPESRFHHSLVS